MSLDFLGSAAWRSLADGGVEFCGLWQEADTFHLEGTAIRFEDRTWRLDYRVVLDTEWVTRRVDLRWRHESGTGEISLAHSGRGHWMRDDKAETRLEGCRDVDFGFSPVTNLMPIRRLAHETGATVDVHAAWLLFPELQLRPASQRYTRIDESLVRYESSSGFRTELEIDAAGFVQNYPGLWKPLDDQRAIFLESDDDR